jgi:hypothetical protein
MTGLRKQLKARRRRYMANPTSKRRRLYLRTKAALRIWDDRMLIDGSGRRHPGNISEKCKRFAVRGIARGLWVTSTTDGQHSANSLHGDGRAVDLGLHPREIGTARGLRRMSNFQIAEWKRGGHTELIGPVNRLTRLRGKPYPLPEGSPLENAHDNHVHGSY